MSVFGADWHEPIELEPGRRFTVEELRMHKKVIKAFKKSFPTPGSGSGYTSDVKIIAFRVTAEIRAELEQEARRTGLSASTVARARYLAGAQR